jgi:hypothetical protein
MMKAAADAPRKKERKPGLPTGRFEPIAMVTLNRPAQFFFARQRRDCTSYTDADGFAASGAPSL